MKIRNKKTGEIREIDPSQLPLYLQTPAPMPTPTPTPTPMPTPQAPGEPGMLQQVTTEPWRRLGGMVTGEERAEVYPGTMGKIFPPGFFQAAQVGAPIGAQLGAGTQALGLGKAALSKLLGGARGIPETVGRVTGAGKAIEEITKGPGVGFSPTKFISQLKEQADIHLARAGGPEILKEIETYLGQFKDEMGNVSMRGLQGIKQIGFSSSEPIWQAAGRIARQALVGPEGIAPDLADPYKMYHYTQLAKKGAGYLGRGAAFGLGARMLQPLLKLLGF